MVNGISQYNIICYMHIAYIVAICKLLVQTHCSFMPCHQRLLPMTLAPETGARKLASVSGASVIQSDAEFWREILESDRTCSISRQNLATT